MKLRIERDESVGRVVTPEGLSFPRRLTARGTVDGLAVTVTISFDEAVGRMAVERLEVGRGKRPVTADALRKVPLAEIVRAATLRSLGVDLEAEGLRGRDFTAAAMATVKLGLDPAQLAAEGPSERALAAAAAIYRAAYVAGDDPIKVVSGMLKRPRSTVARWIVEARRRGLLAPTTRGRARA